MIKPETLDVRPPADVTMPHETRLYLAEQEYQRLARTTAQAYLAFFSGGLFGLHRFYVCRFKSGLAMMFTLGLFGWFLTDLFSLPMQVKDANNMIRNRVNEVYGITVPVVA